jgi:hypothetical protein
MRFSPRVFWWSILSVPAIASAQTLTTTRVPGAVTNFPSPDANSFTTNPKLQLQLPFNDRQHTFLFGPKWEVFAHNRFGVDVWALGGNAKKFALADPFVAPTDATPPLLRDPSTPLSQGRFMGDNGRALVLGGSVNYKINDYLTYDIAKPEFLMIQVKGAPLHDFRIASGMRLSFGK